MNTPPGQFPPHYGQQCQYGPYGEPPKPKNRWWIAVAAVVLIGVIGVVLALTKPWASTSSTPAEASATSSDVAVPRVTNKCVYDDAVDPFEGLPEVFPADSVSEEQRPMMQALFDLYVKGKALRRSAPKPADSRPFAEGDVEVTVDTNVGSVPVTLDRASAPCNVNGFLTLAQEGYYDNVACHAMFLAAANSLAVCGDPTQTALSSVDFVLGGNPGWWLPTEPPRGLTDAGSVDGQSTVKYPRGSVLMLTTQAPGPTDMGSDNYGGGAYMLVLEDSVMAPLYPVIGTVDDSALHILDEIRRGGLVLGTGQKAPNPGEELTSGAPKNPIVVSSIRVTKK